jgi:hypothetical protein
MNLPLQISDSRQFVQQKKLKQAITPNLTSSTAPTYNHPKTSDNGNRKRSTNSVKDHRRNKQNALTKS